MFFARSVAIARATFNPRRVIFLLACTWCVALCVEGTAFAAKPAQVKGVPGSFVLTLPDVTYYALKGDTLSVIAQRYTTQSRNWVRIGQVNHIGNDRRIPIGTAIQIPIELLPEDPSEAKVFALAGAINIKTTDGKESALGLGDSVKEGSQITTSKNGFLTLVLSDDSRVSVPSSSQITVSKLRVVRYVNSPRTEITLTQGKVESKVTPLEKNKGRFEVRSPLAVAGVRGTHFRVGLVGDSSDKDAGIANEVLTGGVAVGTLANPATLMLAASKGNIVHAKEVGKPVDLLPAPLLSDGIALQEKPTVQISGFSMDKARAYHAQISSDAEAQHVLQESVSPQNRFKLDGLPDGDYFVRVTAIDALGLEGLPTIKAFKLKARPEPPFTVQPKAKLRADKLVFAWTEASNASRYRLQVAHDAAFQQIALDQADIVNVEFTADQLTHGSYFWRVASITSITTTGGLNGKADQGPFGDVQALQFLPPQQLAPVVDKGDDLISLNWPSESGQTFLLEIARDAAFTQPYISKELSQPEFHLPRPDAGSYFIRVRATDSDGYVGAFSATQKLEVFARLLSGDGKPVNSGDGVTRQGF